MIRRDYLLRMIEQCVQALTRSLRALEEREFALASQEVEQAIGDLAGLDLDRVSQLSETELLGRLLAGEPTQMLRQKVMLLVALLMRAGDIRAAQGEGNTARLCYLKALNLQLEMLAREGPFEFPEFVPRVEALLGRLEDSSLPARTIAALIQHYEGLGQYGKAEDALYLLLDQEDAGPGLVEFGIQFYERILRRSDEALAIGNLPRQEAESGLAELKVRLHG